MELMQFESGLNRGSLIFGRQYDAFGRDNLPELLYPRLSVLHQPREKDAQAGVYQYRAGVRQGNALHGFDRLFPRALVRRVRLREVTDAVTEFIRDVSVYIDGFVLVDSRAKRCITITT